jgi:hypothetical protein
MVNKSIMDTVGDLDGVLSELRHRGDVLEEYDLPGPRTVNGVAKVAGNSPAKAMANVPPGSAMTNDCARPDQSPSGRTMPNVAFGALGPTKATSASLDPGECVEGGGGGRAAGSQPCA